MSKDYIGLSLNRLSVVVQNLHGVKSLLGSSTMFVETEDLNIAIRRIESQMTQLKSSLAQILELEKKKVVVKGKR
jgi:hypothetical protein